MLPIFIDALGRERRHEMIKVYFYMIFVYIRHYAPLKSFKRWLTWGPQRRTTSEKVFYSVMVPMIELMGAGLRELSWNDRLSDENWHPLAPPGVLWIIDGFPQTVWRPTDKYQASFLYCAGKYCECIYSKSEVASVNSTLNLAVRRVPYLY
jgi:hypothetical protein